MLGAGALGHEGGTPDHSGDDGEHYLANLVVFHSCFLSLFRIAFVGIYGVHMPAELVLRAVEQTMDIFSVAVDDQRRHDRAQKGSAAGHGERRKTLTPAYWLWPQWSLRIHNGSAATEGRKDPRR